MENQSSKKESNRINLLSKFLVGLLAITIFLIVQASAVYNDNGASFQNVNDCGTLNTTGAFYNLTNNVNSTSTCFTILANNTLILGNGKIINYTTNGGNNEYGFDIKNGRNVTVRNFHITESNNVVVNEKRSGINISTGQNIFLENLSIITYMTKSAGVSLSGTDNLTLRDSRIFHYGLGAESFGDGSRAFEIVTSSSNNISIVNNNITGIGLNSGTIVSTVSINNLTLIGNQINSLNSSTSGVHAIDLDDASTNGAVIRNNTLIYKSLSGQYAIGATSLTRSEISNNYVKVVSGASGAIRLDSSGNVTIGNNTIIKESSDDIATLSISPNFASPQIKVINNTIITNSPAIFLGSGGNDAQFIDNKINVSYGYVIELTASLRVLLQNFTILEKNQSSFFDLKVTGDPQLTSVTLVDNFFGNYTFPTSAFNLTLNRTNLGSIMLIGVNGSGQNLSEEITIENNSVKINSANGGLNKSGNITLINLPTNFSDPNIFRNSRFCVECYNFTNLNSGIANFNITNSGNYSIFTTKSPERIDILSPNGTQTSLSFAVNISVVSENPLAHCYYNITRGVSLEVDNTEIPNCQNTTTTVSGDANYVINVFANVSTGQYNTTSASFSVVTSNGTIIVGGGGGGAVSSNIQAVNFSIVSPSFGDTLDVILAKDSVRPRERRFILVNEGVEAIEINLACDSSNITQINPNDIEICDYVSFNQNPIIISEVKSSTTEGIITISTPPNSSFGDKYDFNIIATYNKSSTQAEFDKLSVTARVPIWGIVLKWSFLPFQDVPETSYPIWAISLLTSFILFSGIFLLIKNKLPATSFILGLIFFFISFFSLLFVL